MKTFALSMIFLITWSQFIYAVDEELVLSKLDEYLVLSHSTRNATPESYPGLAVKIKVAREEILEFGEQGIEVLLSEMLNNPSNDRKEDIISFFERGKLSNEKILSAVRTLAGSQEMNETHPTTLIKCIHYLGHYGTQEDIQFLRTFSSHDYQSVYTQVKLAVRWIQERENGDNSDNSQDSPEPKSEPLKKAVEPKAIFANKQPSLDKKSTQSEVSANGSDSDNPFPYWVFIIIGVLALGLVVIVRR